MGELATPARSATLDRLERESFDCAVIGGGISGAGVAREASLRGLSVALLEAEDFASGTSSRSSKLIHGGLRYLAMGDVALVRTTALERKQIFRLAPHLAERRWMVVPVRSYASLLKLRAAITTYEKLGAVEGADLHQNWGVSEIEREEPALDVSVYQHACVYREYLTDDAHLVLANLRSAAGLGAAVLNHARVDAIVQDQARAAGVEAVCRLSGRRVRVRARCVINAAGPWVEAVRRLESPAAPPLLHLSKGVHVVVTCRTAAGPQSPDPEHAGPPLDLRDPPRPVRGDRDHRHQLHERGRRVARDHARGRRVPARAARPLPARREARERRRDRRLGGAAPADRAAGQAALRDLATRRGADRARGRRHHGRRKAHGLPAAGAGDASSAPPRSARCGSRRRPSEDPPLPGGDFDGDLAALEAALMRETGVSAVAAARLARLHGTEAREVARDGTQELVPGVLESEIDFAVRREGAATLEDLLYRRLRTSLYAGSEREAAVLPAAERMAQLLGWDAARKQAEVRGVRAQLAADLAFRDEAPSEVARAVGSP